MGQGGGKIKKILKSSYWVVSKCPQGGGLSRGKVSLWASSPPCPRMPSLPRPLSLSVLCVARHTLSRRSRATHPLGLPLGWGLGTSEGDMVAWGIREKGGEVVTAATHGRLVRNLTEEKGERSKRNF